MGEERGEDIFSYVICNTTGFLLIRDKIYLHSQRAGTFIFDNINGVIISVLTFISVFC